MRKHRVGLGQIIKRARNAKGLKQQQLAVMLRVSIATVSRWEADEIHPGGEHLVGLGGALDLPSDWFSDDEPHLSAPKKLSTHIPVFGYGSAGDGIEVDDHGYPIGHGDFEIMRSANNPDPYAYATRVKGNSMYPRLWDGDVVEVRTDVQVRTGDIAIVIQDDTVKWIKRVTIRGTSVRCEPLNPSEQPFVLQLDKVRLHKVVSIRSQGMY